MPTRRMPTPALTAFVLAAGLPTTLGAVLASPALAQPEAPPSQPAGQPAGAGEQPAYANGRPMRFNFAGTPWNEVLNFFSRESGLPIIREGQVPSGGMEFISSEAYSFADALSILNRALNVHGVHLRREGDFLYLASIEDSMRRPGMVIQDGALPEGVTPDQIVTITIPLSNALAKQVVEQV
ncbi:MAG: hypothetical protein KDA05_10850, partial [Phycisphaerales bacterium]|nr:hypothetical protein [Phycisphaerales bacterium]